MDVEVKQVSVSIKSGSGGRSFGSVSTKEIAAAAKSQLGYELDKKKMELDKDLLIGEYINKLFTQELESA